MKKNIIALLVLFFILSSNAKKTVVDIVKIDASSIFKKENMTGSFSCFSLKKNQYFVTDENLLTEMHTPASTFKICNTLIGLQTGIIRDEHFVIKWDSIERRSIWNQNHDLEMAFHNSTVWYYQEMARRIGEKKMSHWVEKLKFGNEKTGGGIDRFWLTGDLKVSPKQEIDFLVKLYKNKLPCSKTNMNILKKIMVASDTNGFVLRGKTGWGEEGNNEIGWYVGYLENKDDILFFATCLKVKFTSNSDEELMNFINARKKISLKLLNQLFPSFNLKIDDLSF